MKYRTVDVRLWHDRRFLSLSNDGRLLWLFLLTSSTLPIPGILIGGESAMAEQLGWPVKRYRERFQELFDVGMKVRMEGRLVWLSNALKYQPPCNPNMVKAWAKFWDDIPDGALKGDIWQALKIACKTWSRLFNQLFPESPADGYAQLLLEPFVEPLATKNKNKNNTKNKNKREGEPAQPSRKEVPIPDDWKPDDTPGNQKTEESARAKGVDLHVELEQFRDHALSKGRMYRDWNAAWRTWLRNARPRQHHFHRDSSPARGAAAALHLVELEARREVNGDS